MRTWVLDIIDKLANHAGPEPNQTQVENWVREFDQYHYVTMERAADDWIKHNKWFPKLSEFHSLVLVHADTSNKRATYWRAMDAYNDCLAGARPWNELDRDPNWHWFEEHEGEHVPETLDAVLCNV